MKDNFKEMKAGKWFLIVQKENGHNRYLNGQFNPKIGLTTHPDAAKHYETFDEAQKELEQLQLAQNGFVVEEHEWV